MLMGPLPASAQESGAFLYGGEVFVEPQGEAGPWFYQGPEMTATVSRASFEGKRYILADVWTREGLTVSAGAAGGAFRRHQTEEPRDIARRYSAVLAFTGDFLLHSGNPKGVMIRDGEVYYDRDQADTLAVMPDGTLRAYPAGTVRAQALLDLGVRQAFAFGPILILDGEAYRPALSHSLRGPNRRCALAMAEPRHLYQVTTVDRFSNAEMQRLFLCLGATVAYQMDGGQSAVLVLMGEQLNAHHFNPELAVYQRPLNDLVIIGHSGLTPGLEDAVRYQDLILH